MYRFTLLWTTKFVGGVLHGCQSESMARFVSRKAAKEHIDFLLRSQHNSTTSIWVAENIRLEEIV